MSRNQPTRTGRRKSTETPDNSAKPASGTARQDEQDSEKQHLDERLEEALEETFPASDPIALTPPRKAEPNARKGKPPRHTKYGGPAASPRKR